MFCQNMEQFSISTNFPVDTMWQNNATQRIKGEIRSSPYMFLAEKKKSFKQTRTTE